MKEGAQLPILISYSLSVIFDLPLFPLTFSLFQFPFTLQALPSKKSMQFKSFLPATIWFIITIILLALPGDDLPHGDLFNIPYFDKYVHFGMFFILTFLFCWPFLDKYQHFQPWKSTGFKIALYVILYGVAMEFVQKYFVRGRSFDVFDILFDSLGSFGGLIGIWRYPSLKKNRPR